MKKIVFIVVFFIFLSGVIAYVEIGNRRFKESLPEPPKPAEQPKEQADGRSPDSEPQWSEQVFSDESDVDTSTAETAVNPDESGSNDWRTDSEHPHDHISETDPWSDLIAEEEAKAHGTWIDDPETMDSDDLRDAEYNRLLKEFGDIIEVHTYMDYMHKFDSGVPLSLGDRITGLKAAYHLFPYQSTKKTIAFYEWQEANGGPDSLKYITAEDIAYFRSLGITVTETQKGYSISTE